MVRVKRVPTCGYVVIGRGTFRLGEILEPSKYGANAQDVEKLLEEKSIAEFEVRVRRVPECGYVVIGRGTFQLGQVLDPSKCDTDAQEVRKLCEENYIELIEMPQCL